MLSKCHLRFICSFPQVVLIARMSMEDSCNMCDGQRPEIPSREQEGAGESMPDAFVAWADHAFNIICNQDSDCYLYLMKWAAHVIQKPESKAMVAAPLLFSEQGAGKGF